MHEEESGTPKQDFCGFDSDDEGTPGSREETLGSSLIASSNGEETNILGMSASASGEQALSMSANVEETLGLSAHEGVMGNSESSTNT